MTLIVVAPELHDPCGHLTRCRALIGEWGAESVLTFASSDIAQAGAGDVVVMDTYAFGYLRDAERLLRQARERGAKLVWMRRRLPPPAPWYAGAIGTFDLVIVPGPYEGMTGDVTVDPLIAAADPGQPSRTLIVTSMLPARRTLWEEVASIVPDAAIATPERLHAVRDWRSRDWRGGASPRSSMLTADVVIGSGGLTMYEALWSGARYVALEMAIDQPGRVENATAAGEPVVRAQGSGRVPAAVAAALQLEKPPVRQSGAAAAVSAIRALA